MITKWINVLSVALASIVLCASFGFSQNDTNERHTKVVMRMIGDEILWNAGDSTSRVLAIENETNRYKIQFESEFEFNPEELQATIGEIIKETKVAKSYIVEVEECESKMVVYSYEIQKATEPDLIPCKTRNQPKGCYKIFVTILEEGESRKALYNDESKAATKPPSASSKSTYLVLLVAALFFVGIILWLRARKNKASSPIDTDSFTIGNYLFDKKAMTLSIGNEKSDLSSKEADLLSLFYSAENKTLDREYILNVVWGDEGDYVGRTLDVFISKLRKKLAEDPSLKIINIRGVGYKFVVNK